MREIKLKKFSRKIREIIKEKELNAFYVENLTNKIDWFSTEDLIFVNWEKDLYTKRFTLCHELWHSVFNHQFWDSKEEREADNYACSLLIDEKELREKVEEGWTLWDLEKFFWVPEKEILKFAKQIFNDKNLNFIF